MAVPNDPRGMRSLRLVRRLVEGLGSKGVYDMKGEALNAAVADALDFAVANAYGGYKFPSPVREWPAFTAAAAALAFNVSSGCGRNAIRYSTERYDDLPAIEWLTPMLDGPGLLVDMLETAPGGPDGK